MSSPSLDYLKKTNCPFLQLSARIAGLASSSKNLAVHDGETETDFKPKPGNEHERSISMQTHRYAWTRAKGWDRPGEKNISTNADQSAGSSSSLMRIIMLLCFTTNACMCAWWWRGNLRLEDEIDARPARSARLFIFRSEGRREIVWTHQQKVTSSLTHQQLRLCPSHHTTILCVLICDTLWWFFNCFQFFLSKHTKQCYDLKLCTNIHYCILYHCKIW
jgi:hypothetical protein